MKKSAVLLLILALILVGCSSIEPAPEHLENVNAFSSVSQTGLPQEASVASEEPSGKPASPAGAETAATTTPVETDLPETQPSTAPTEPPHTHSYAAAETVASTCTADGYTVYRCACGDSCNGDYISAAGHSWSGWTVIQEATISAEGLQSRSCTVCGATEEQTIPQIEFDLEAAMAEAEEWGRQYAVNTYGYTIDYSLSLTNYNGYSSMLWDDLDWIISGKGLFYYNPDRVGVDRMKDMIAAVIDDMYESSGLKESVEDGTYVPGTEVEIVPGVFWKPTCNIDIYQMGNCVYYAFVY